VGKAFTTWIGYLLAVVAIGGLVYNEVLDETAEQEFFTEMRIYHKDNVGHTLADFIEAGDRNTAKQGMALCMRIAHLESEHHNEPPPQSCVDLYEVHE
jgi:hypothetical protein